MSAGGDARSRQCRKASRHACCLAPGLMSGDVATAQAQLAQGFRALAYSGDLWLYQQALRQGLDALRQ